MQAWITLKATESGQAWIPLKSYGLELRLRKDNMNKHIFDLQLFADDNEPGASADGNTNETEPGKGEGTGSGEKQPENVPKYTDADLDRIINKKFAELEQKKKKEIDEAKKLANMNAQQKAEHERDLLQKELDDYKRRDSLAEMTKTARKMLSDEGISVGDDLLSVMVSTDAEQTKSAIDSFSKMFKSAVEAAVNERIKGSTPKKSTGGGSMTKEQIMAIKDQELRQQKILENRHLFNM